MRLAPAVLALVAALAGASSARANSQEGAVAAHRLRAAVLVEVNEYTAVAGVTRVHDDNGNLTDDGLRFTYAYDYKNRLVEVHDRTGGALVVRYLYLPDGRRHAKVTPGGTTYSYWDGAQEVEERAPTGTTTYVWSPVYVDELVCYTNWRGTFYTHQDARSLRREAVTTIRPRQRTPVDPLSR